MEWFLLADTHRSVFTVKSQRKWFRIEKDIFTGKM